MSFRIDLNCDIGESFGAWTIGDDARVLAHVTSANIACGFHAGDPDTMRRTVALAIAAGVALGAHVGLPDLQGFGRRAIDVSADETYAMTLYQIGALAGFARAAGARLCHVKPHGALYNMAARDRALACAIAQATCDFDSRLILVGLAGSELPRAAERAGLACAAEAFVDRRYQRDGSLLSRRDERALIGDNDEAIAQALALASRTALTTSDGAQLTVQADTICIHGDRADAAGFAERVRGALERAGIDVRPLKDSDP